MLMSSAAPLSQLEHEHEFIARHIGIGEADEKHMLSVIGQASRRALIDSIVPASIARSQAMKLPASSPPRTSSPSITMSDEVDQVPTRTGELT